MNHLANIYGKTKAEIDMLIWNFCAKDRGAVCTATPRCEICPIRKYFNFNY